MGPITLPIPIDYNGKLYKTCSIKKIIESGVLADTLDEFEKTNAYRGMQELLIGCIESIDDINDKSSLKAIIQNMPYKAAEYVVIKILINHHKDGSVQGVYQCPLCPEKIICDKTDDIDTSDYLEDQPVHINKSDQISVSRELVTPVTILDKDDKVAEKITSIEMVFPTLKHCSNAHTRLGDKNKGQLQFGIYMEALTKINGKEIDNKWKNRYAMYLFKKMNDHDTSSISNDVNKYGMDTSKEKTCRECGKKFEAVLNTSSFFSSALRSK